LIRTRVSEIRELGRATQGVRLIALDAGEKLSGLEKVAETGEDEAIGDTAASEDGATELPDNDANPAGGEAEN
jgi:DNA gyrase subunit A